MRIPVALAITNLLTTVDEDESKQQFHRYHVASVMFRNEFRLYHCVMETRNMIAQLYNEALAEWFIQTSRAPLLKAVQQFVCCIDQRFVDALKEMSLFDAVREYHTKLLRSPSIEPVVLSTISEIEKNSPTSDRRARYRVGEKPCFQPVVLNSHHHESAPTSPTRDFTPKLKETDLSDSLIENISVTKEEEDRATRLSRSKSNWKEHCETKKVSTTKRNILADTSWIQSRS